MKSTSRGLVEERVGGEGGKGGKGIGEKAWSKGGEKRDRGGGVPMG